jgi:hypothetical protein
MILARLLFVTRQTSHFLVQPPSNPPHGRALLARPAAAGVSGTGCTRERLLGATALRKLLPDKHLAGCAERYKVKGRLAKVDATECICMSMILLHRNCLHDPPANPGKASGGPSH